MSRINGWSVEVPVVGMPRYGIQIDDRDYGFSTMEELYRICTVFSVPVEMVMGLSPGQLRAYREIERRNAVVAHEGQELIKSGIFAQNKIWVDTNGKVFEIDEIPTPHLKNIIAWLDSHHKRINERIGRDLRKTTLYRTLVRELEARPRVSEAMIRLNETINAVAMQEQGVGMKFRENELVILEKSLRLQGLEVKPIK